MTRDEQKKALMRQIAFWARSHGKPAPTTPDGWKILVAEFTAQAMAARHAAEEQQVAQPTWDEVPDEQNTHLVDDGATVQIADELHEGTFEDDWHRLLRDRAAAAIGPNGELLDDFDQEFQLLGTQQAAVEKNAPFSSTNPRSVFTGSLGGQASIDVDGQTRMVARWQGEDHETLPVTITFGPSSLQLSNPALAVPVGIRAFGRATFGTHGRVVTAEVDITTGCQFTVGASTVVLEVGATTITGAGGNTLQMLLSGLLSFHPVVRTAPLTSTRVYNLNNSNTGTVAIPAFAKEILVFRSDPTTAITIDIMDIAGAVIQSVLLAANAQMTTPIPISGAAGNFRLTNTTATQAYVNAIFNLGI